MNIVRRSFTALLALGLLAGAGALRAAPLHVVASFSILGDLVRVVGGEDIVLDVLVGPGQDPHGYEAPPQAVQRLARAQVLVENGLGFETWLDRLVGASGFRGQRIVASDGVPARVLAATDDDHDADHVHGDGHAHAAGAVDPHAWQDLRNAMVYVRNIAAGLARADAAHAAAYQRRAEAYLAQLAAADMQWRARFAALPVQPCVAITAHQAFGYAADAWGIDFLSAAGLSSDAEPSAREMAALIARARRPDGIVGVFAEKGTNPRLVRQLGREAGVIAGGWLYSDALDAPDHPAGTYLGMMAWNARQLLAVFE